MVSNNNFESLNVHPRQNVISATTTAMAIQNAVLLPVARMPQPRGARGPRCRASPFHLRPTFSPNAHLTQLLPLRRRLRHPVWLVTQTRVAEDANQSGNPQPVG
jgi:hypothetical protein